MSSYAMDAQGDAKMAEPTQEKDSGVGVYAANALSRFDSIEGSLNQIESIIRGDVPAIAMEGAEPNIVSMGLKEVVAQIDNHLGIVQSRLSEIRERLAF